jgi:glucose-1-phosphate adenylyltransferase
MFQNKDLYLNEKVASVVLAGGLGTRLYPLTMHRCKPGVCFAGKYRLIDVPISNSLNAQISQIFVISQYFASSLQTHLVSAYPHNHLQKGNMQMLCPEETDKGPSWFLGTADAVRKNIRHIDLIQMVEFAVTKKADLVVAALPVGPKDATRMGLLQISSEHRIEGFIEKPKDPKVLEQFTFCDISTPMHSCYLGSMGIYVFKKQVLLNLLKEKGDDFGKDLIPMQVKRGGSFAFVYDGYWEDIGTIESYYLANLALLDQKQCLKMEDLLHPIYTLSDQLPSSRIVGSKIENSIISPGCIIEGREIIRSVVGVRTHIGRGSFVKDSVIMGEHGKSEEHLRIGEKCIIEKAIIDEQAVIGNGVTLKNEKSIQYYDGDGIFIRDGIIIVASGTKVPDGFVL